MSTFKIKSIISSDNFFKRAKDIDFAEVKGAVSNLDIEIKKDAQNERDFSVLLSVTISQKLGDKILVEGGVTMVGDFQVEGDLIDSVIENFSRINGPAILFPYAREYFSSTSVRCGLPAIIIPPVNFVEKDRLEREKGKVVD